MNKHNIHYRAWSMMEYLSSDTVSVEQWYRDKYWKRNKRIKKHTKLWQANKNRILSIKHKDVKNSE